MPSVILGRDTWLRAAMKQVLYSFADLEKVATPGHAEALRFARKLTSIPHTIVDADITRLKEK